MTLLEAINTDHPFRREGWHSLDWFIHDTETGCLIAECTPCHQREDLLSQLILSAEDVCAIDWTVRTEELKVEVTRSSILQAVQLNNATAGMNDNDLDWISYAAADKLCTFLGLGSSK